jgi:hypothetical protein
MLVIDEAYREFTEAEFDRSSLLRDFENVILVRTCSKAFFGCRDAAGLPSGSSIRGDGAAENGAPVSRERFRRPSSGFALWRHKAEFLRRVQDLIAARDGLMAGAAN